MDPQLARELATRGATFVMLGVPEGTVVGIDHQVFLTGPMFRGVKMVPPGAHLISYRAGSTGSYGPTTCFFTHPRGGEVQVWKWDPKLEILEKCEQEIESVVSAVKAFQLDRSLGPYDLGKYPAWQSLSQYITPSLIDTLQPVSGNICILAEPWRDDASASAAEQVLDDQLKHRRAVMRGNTTTGQANTAEHAGRCFYTQLPRLVKQKGMTPAELTAVNLDKSHILEEVLRTKLQNDEGRLLGELQFAFLAFLLGHSIEGFLQWKSIVGLLLGCAEAALTTHVGLFTSFLCTLHAQLTNTGRQDAGETGSNDILADDFLCNSFFKNLFAQWMEALNDAGEDAPPRLQEQALKLVQVLQCDFGWNAADLNLMEDEPLVVLESDVSY